MAVWLTSGQFSSLMTSLLSLNLIQIISVRLSETESLLDRRLRQRRPTCSLRPGGLTHSGINHSGNRHVLYFFLSHTLTVHQTTHTHIKTPHALIGRLIRCRHTLPHTDNRISLYFGGKSASWLIRNTMLPQFPTWKLMVFRLMRR